MSELIKGLNRICQRFEIHTSHRVSALKPDLSLKEIEKLIKNTPFKLPSEVYELYQWRNGSSGWDFLFENYEFLSLQRAIYEYQQELRQVQTSHPKIANIFQYRFPLFQNTSECGVFLMVAPDSEMECPIYGYDISFNDYSPRYRCLTDLILHSAEWYESAIFVEHDNEWVINDEESYWLDTKYLTKERIIELMNGNGGLQQFVYQSFLDRSNT